MERKPYRVKPGAVLAHQETELRGGADVQLPPHIAYEVRHLVDPVDEAGAVKPWGTVDDVALEQQLATARPHERISLIKTALDAKKGDVAKLQAAYDVEVKDNAATAKALEKPKPAAPAKAAAGAALQK